MAIDYLLPSHHDIGSTNSYRFDHIPSLLSLVAATDWVSPEPLRLTMSINCYRSQYVVTGNGHQWIIRATHWKQCASMGHMYILSSPAIYVYVKYDLHFFLARCPPAAECLFSHFRPRGNIACHGYIMKHVWISAELRGGARRIKRRSAGSIWQGIAFRPPETSRSLGTPQTVFQMLIF